MPGFTLIEMLVVISIVSALLAILLPALQKARQQAQLIRCSAQLRQIGLSHLIYADAHREWFPIAYYNSHALLAMDRSLGQTGVDHSIGSWYGNNLDQFKCPSTLIETHTASPRVPGEDGRTFEAGITVGIDNQGTAVRGLITGYRFAAARGSRRSTESNFNTTFYGLRHRGTGLRDDNRVSAAIPNVRFAGRTERDPFNGQEVYLHNPSMMPMAADGRRGSTSTWSPYNANGVLFNNHIQLGASANILFLDGRAITASQEPGQGEERLMFEGDHLTGTTRLQW